GFDRAADNLRIAAVALLPEAVADDDGLRAIQKSFLIYEWASQERLHAEGCGEIYPPARAGNNLQAIRFLESDAAAGVHGQLLEGLALLLPIPEVRRRVYASAFLFLRIEGFHGHEPRRIVGEPPQQGGVDDAEYRRVCADAQAKRNDANNRE